MEVNWLVLGIIAFCTIILVVYLIRRNLKDKNEVAESFNEEVKTERDFELDNDDEV